MNIIILASMDAFEHGYNKNMNVSVLIQARTPHQL